MDACREIGAEVKKKLPDLVDDNKLAPFQLTAGIVTI